MSAQKSDRQIYPQGNDQVVVRNEIEERKLQFEE
jgi:hypothetical protein